MPWALAFAIAAATSLAAVAHDSPNDRIHDLSHRIEEAPTARLHAARAYEYRAIGELHAAVADFRAAIALSPTDIASRLGLASTLLDLGRPEAARQVAREGIETAGETDARAPFHAVIAQAYMADRVYQPALDAWSRALEAERPKIDWFLEQAECLRQLGRPTARRDALATAITRNPSIVLRRVWIASLIDSGDFEEASKAIDLGLENTRLRSSWLLLRARLYRGLGEESESKADAKAALDEIEQRLDLDRPDPFLLVDAGAAYALLGDRDAAERYLSRARDADLSEAWIREAMPR